MTDASFSSLIFDQPVGVIAQTIEDFVAQSDNLFFDREVGANNREFSLLFEGLTFVLRCQDAPQDLSGYQKIFLSRPIGSASCAVSIHFGPNLREGLKIPSLALGYLQLVAHVANGLGAVAVAANAAMVLTQTQYFVDAVEAYTNGGAFPALATIAFAPTEDGTVLATRGLGALSGQELLFERAGLDDTEVMRRMVRLVHDICVNGPITTVQTVPDLRDRYHLRLEPDETTHHVCVTLHFGGKADLD